MDDFFNLAGPRHPPPLSPTRKIELVRTKSGISGPCCSCARGSGKLECVRCKAIKYCGKECQTKGSPIEGRNGWKWHKGNCNSIKKLCEETTAAGEALANEFGGTENLLQTELVKEGRLKYRDIAGEQTGREPPAIGNNPQERYILARMRLIEAYVKCGEEALSCAAFRLAAENMLDLLCLTFEKHKGEHLRFIYCGWMVAGGMDQQALNYICYFQHRRLSPHPLPYLDLSNNEDIEGDVQKYEVQTGDEWLTFHWFHDYMLIALIKYKRLQDLLVQRQKNKVIWTTFMMGTHPRAGEKSVILGIRGKTPVIEKLKDYFEDKKNNSRVEQLTNQIKQILTAVNEKNPLLIPGIIDRNSIPDDPLFQNRDEDGNPLLEDDYEFDEHTDDIHDAKWAFANYGHAWNMSRSYKRVLQLFLQNGNVTICNEFGITPVEGFLQAAFDADPTRPYDHMDDLFTNRMFF